MNANASLAYALSPMRRPPELGRKNRDVGNTLENGRWGQVRSVLALLVALMAAGGGVAAWHQLMRPTPLPVLPLPSLNIMDVGWRYRPEEPDGDWAGPRLKIPFTICLSNVIIHDGSKVEDVLKKGLLVAPQPTRHNPEKQTFANNGIFSVRVDEALPVLGFPGLKNIKCTVTADLHFSTQFANVSFEDEDGKVVGGSFVWGQK